MYDMFNNSFDHTTYHPCSFCGGSGKEKCEKCNGTGVIEDVSCSKCNGTGKVECSMCHGTKQLSEW